MKDKLAITFVPSPDKNTEYILLYLKGGISFHLFTMKEGECLLICRSGVIVPKWLKSFLKVVSIDEMTTFVTFFNSILSNPNVTNTNVVKNSWQMYLKNRERFAWRMPYDLRRFNKER